MRLSSTFALAIVLLALSGGGPDTPRAGEADAPPQDGEMSPYKARNAALFPVKTEGELHGNALGKPCLAYRAYSRPYLIDKKITDYVVVPTNSCPTAIRIRICQTDRSGCQSALVPAYKSTDIVMGIGPQMDTFHYLARELP